MTGMQALLDKATYKAYLERLDARALLEHYGALNCRDEHNKDGTTEVIHSCLLDRVEPHHSNGDQSPSAACNVDKKTYVCYSSGMGCDLFHLVMKLEGKESFSESMSVIGSFLTGAVKDREEIRKELEQAFARPEAYTINLPSYDPAVLNPWLDMPHPYWAERGITEGAQAILQLGYDPTARRIVFPHFVDNILVGWQKRVVPSGWGWEATVPDYPKYKNSPGFPKSETLYNLDRARQYETVIVVESPMSVAKALSVGLPNVVATFGAKVTEQQLFALKDFHRIYVWFDRDKAGIGGEIKQLEGLYRRADVRVVTPDWGKDMGDCTHDEMIAKLLDATPAALRLGEYDMARKMR